jgi:hypothetical protein
MKIGDKEKGYKRTRVLQVENLPRVPGGKRDSRHRAAVRVTGPAAVPDHKPARTQPRPGQSHLG